MTPLLRIMLLASVLIWCHAPQSVCGFSSLPTSPVRAVPKPVNPARTGPEPSTTHLVSMGETTSTTGNDRDTPSTSTIEIINNPQSANIPIYNKSYTEFFDMFCFIGVLYPFVYFCHARLRKAAFYVLSIITPMLCVTYFCLRQWKWIKEVAGQYMIDMTTYVSSATSSPYPSSSMTPMMPYVIIVGLLAREWGFFHAFYDVCSRTLTSLKSLTGKVHSTSIPFTFLMNASVIATLGECTGDIADRRDVSVLEKT